MTDEIRGKTKEAVYSKYAELCRRQPDLGARDPEPNRDDVFEAVRWDKKTREWVLRYHLQT
jgi:hypothetical protein